MEYLEEKEIRRREDKYILASPFIVVRYQNFLLKFHLRQYESEETDGLGAGSYDVALPSSHGRLGDIIPESVKRQVGGESMTEHNHLEFDD